MPLPAHMPFTLGIGLRIAKQVATISCGKNKAKAMAKDISGKNRFKRLDMSMSAVRDKVLKAAGNEELDRIFDTDGFFM